MTNRIASVGRSLRTALAVAANAAAEDPVMAASLAVRTLPARLRRGMARAVIRATRRPSAVRGLATWSLHGADAALAEAAETAVQIPPGTAVRLVALALTLDRPAVAQALLSAANQGHRAVPRLQAWAAWMQGDLTEAVRLLDGVPAGGGLEALRRARMLARYRGELAVLDRARLAAALECAERPARPHPAALLRTTPGRVLHVVTNSLPHVAAGYTLRTQMIVRAQREHGLDPHVVTRLGFPAAQGRMRFAADETVDGIPYHRLLPRSGLPRSAADRLELATELLLALARDLRPSVLHAATDHLNAQPALAVGRRLGIPVVYEVRGFLEESWLSRRDKAGDTRDRALRSDRYRLSRQMETSCMLEADAVTTLAEVMAAEIRDRSVPADKITVVPNAVLPEFLETPADSAATRRHLGIAPEDVVVGTITTFYAHEGVQYLLEAGRQLLAAGAPLRLLLVGDGPELPGLQRLARDLGIHNSVVFTGRVPFADVRRLYGALDVFAVPRTNDRVSQMVTPLKPVEAMAARRPVIGSDLPALRELVTPGVTGALARPEDAAALADALCPLLYDAALRARLGTAAHEWVRQNRTWSRNAERYMDVYGAVGALTS